MQWLLSILFTVFQAVWSIPFGLIYCIVTPFLSFKGRFWKVPQAFARERLAIRPLDRDGRYGIFFASWQVASIDLTNGQPVSDVSEQVSAMSPD